MGARSACERAARQAGARAWAAATRGGAWQAQAGARGAAGWAAWACSWARLGVLVHLTQFLAWFNSVFS